VPRDQQLAARPPVVSPITVHPAVVAHAHPRVRAPKAVTAVAKHHVAPKQHVAVRPVAAQPARPAATHASAPVTSPPPVASTTRHHHHASTVAPPTKAPTTHPKPKPKLAARTTPSASAVKAAIQGLKSYVHSILSPTPAQVAQFGDMVCTAYDHGDTTAAIESTILKKVSSLPLTTILPGAADYVVRTAVKLYCPGYKSRLGSAAG
jgi:hypothetical protein